MIRVAVEEGVCKRGGGFSFSCREIFRMFFLSLEGLYIGLDRVYITLRGNLEDLSGRRENKIGSSGENGGSGMEENRVERIRGRSVAILAVNTADTARGEFCQINNSPKARAQLASVVVLLARDVTSSKTLLLPGPVHPPPPH